MFREIERDLCEITGYDSICLQPNRYAFFVRGMSPVVTLCPFVAGRSGCDW